MMLPQGSAITTFADCDWIKFIQCVAKTLTMKVKLFIEITWSFTHQIQINLHENYCN